MKPFLGFLYELVKYNRNKRPINVLEIGVCKGYSTNAFLSALSKRRYGGMLYSIDKRVSRYDAPEEYEKYWTFIKNNSRKEPWDKKIDILMIDGDRSYEGTKFDFDKFSPFVRDDGFILLHEMATSRKESYRIWEEIDCPKIILPMGRNGLGVVAKKDYWEINNK